MPASTLFFRSSAILLLCAGISQIEVQAQDDIFTAISQNKVDAVTKILEAKPEAVKSKNAQEQTPLHWASQRGSTELVSLLLKYKPELNSQDRYGYTPLHWATFNQRIESVSALIEAGADVAVADKNKNTPLTYALQHSRQGYNHPVLGVLLTKVKDVNKPIQDSLTPLHLAAQVGSADAVTKLLARKADATARDDKERTPLDYAMIGDHFDAAGLLIAHTKVKDYKTPTGDSLLHWAARNGQEEATATIIEQGADVNATNKNGERPLQNAAWHGHAKVVSLLLEKGADAKQTDPSGQTALHMAAWNGHIDAVNALLESKADPSVAANKYSPLHGAAWNGHTAVVAALIKAGAKVDAVDSDGNTPLHKAAWRGHVAAVKELLNAGANKAAKDNFGQTAADKAKSAKHTGVISALGE